MTACYDVLEKKINMQNATTQIPWTSVHAFMHRLQTNRSATKWQNEESMLGWLTWCWSALNKSTFNALNQRVQVAWSDRPVVFHYQKISGEVCRNDLAAFCHKFLKTFDLMSMLNTYQSSFAFWNHKPSAIRAATTTAKKKRVTPNTGTHAHSQLSVKRRILLSVKLSKKTI